MGQDQIVGNDFLQSLEGLNLTRTPDERIFIFQEIGQWSGNLSEMLKVLVVYSPRVSLIDSNI